MGDAAPRVPDNGAMSTPPCSHESSPVTYRLYIRLHRRTRLEPGRLGPCLLERGWYVYTGSARRTMRSRLRRHLGHPATRRWHIDWLLHSGAAEIAHIRLDTAPECAVNAREPGRVVVAGFGASDCRAGCRSHLLWLGTRRPRAVPREPRRRCTRVLVERAHTAGDAA